MAAGDRDRLLRTAALVNLTSIVLTVLLFVILRGVVPPPVGVADPGSRLARWAGLALAPALVLVAMVGGVLVARARSLALNPIDDPETRFHRISQRVLTNTVEQTLVFLPALAALTVWLPLPDLGAPTVATALFVAGRLLFWAGYLVHPYARAPGMAMTLATNLLVIGWALMLAMR